MSETRVGLRRSRADAAADDAPLAEAKRPLPTAPTVSFEPEQSDSGPGGYKRTCYADEVI
jgi:hypothetical protein